jgi:iron complex outermembrane receptor protein
VNVNGTIGRGSSAVDLNTIPAAMVQSIEVLRGRRLGAVRLRRNRRRAQSALCVSRPDGGDANRQLRLARLHLRHTNGRAGRSSPAVLTPTWSAPPKLSRSVSDGEDAGRFRVEGDCRSANPAS